ncbi:hypothetical protein EIP86_000541 [Pleurotus ostreatoroseus]|nr:hypothetical protein EIP86_000541 [Pleurotus ostreatoroseus]
MEETLVHIAEAHFRDAWCVAAKVDDLAQLRDKTPEQLLDLADTVLEKFASTDALDKERARDRKIQDDILIRSIQFNRDVLDFLELDEAMHVGDVGRMRDLLPRLLFRFVGGGHTNYVTEILEVIQGLEREWTDEFTTYIMRYFWLVNVTGRPEHFEPVDSLMERNIRDTKGSFAMQGPHASWENIKRVSAAIPAMRRIKDHVEAEINHFLRGKSHTSPEKEVDVARLQASYAASSIHVYNRRRQVSKECQVQDFIAKGSDPEKLKKAIQKWQENRNTERSSREDWSYGYDSPSQIDDINTSSGSTGTV